MTDLLTTDHADSGEVVRLNPSIVDTFVLDLGETTRNLTPYIHGLQPSRRPDATGEQPLYRPLTIGVVDALQEPPIGPVPPPSPLPPAPPGSVYDRRPVKPLLRRGGHRAPAPVWAWRALLVGLGSVGTVVVELAGIAALVVLR